MAKLTSKKRNALPKSEFALPGRRYPVNDKAHAANAKARASQQVAAGNLSSEEKAKIDRKADRVLNEHEEAVKKMNKYGSHKYGK